MIANVVGPVCETGDTFATAREMDRVEAGDLVLFRTAGAYAAAMSSTYNSRAARPPKCWSTAPAGPSSAAASASSS